MLKTTQSETDHCPYFIDLAEPEPEGGTVIDKLLSDQINSNCSV